MSTVTQEQIAAFDKALENVKAARRGKNWVHLDAATRELKRAAFILYMASDEG